MFGGYFEIEELVRISVLSIIVVDEIFDDIKDEESDERGEEEVFGEVFVDITEIEHVICC